MALRVNPTRMELSKTKKRLSTAVRGHKLLKDKQDEMARQFMLCIRRNRELRLEIAALMSDASRAAAVAEAQMGKAEVEEALMMSNDLSSFECGTKNIMSVETPEITVNPASDELGEVSYGFAYSSPYLDKAVIAMKEIMPKLLELAAIEKTCDMLADEMQRTRRRVNALEHVMIPDMKSTIKMIRTKLEDNERGTLTRLMKVKEMMVED